MPIASVSPSPELDDTGDAESRIESMVEWFHQNFEDPANSLPYESAEDGYQWIWGGPYDAREELHQAFPDAEVGEIEAAVKSIEDDGIYEWTVNSKRVEDYPDNDDPDDGLAEYDGSQAREVPDRYDPHRFTVVETHLLPRQNFGWSIHALFVPVKTNQSISEVVETATETGSYGRDDYQFKSLRDLVAVLVGRQLVGRLVDENPDLEKSLDWLKTLSADDEVFVDDGVIVHASPPEWLPLRELFKHGSVGGVALISQSPGHWTGVLLMYGGSLLFLRLVRNLNFVQDAFFERWAKRIKKGENDPF